MELNEFEKARIAYNELQLKVVDNRFREKILSEIQASKEDIIEVCKIENDDRVSLDKIFNIIESLNDEKEKVKITLEEKQADDGFILGRYKASIGTLGVIYDGDPYITLSLAMKAINTKNVMVFCTDNSLYAINSLLAIILNRVLIQYGYPDNMIQVINSEKYEEMFKHNNLVDKMIVIGNRFLQNQVRSRSNLEVISSGYNSYDLYIEDVLDKELIKKVLEVPDVKYNIYINEEIEGIVDELNIDEYTPVSNVEECIRDINMNSSKYSSSIFTSKGENGNKFLKLVSSKTVAVNAAPLIERKLDITEEDLLNIKQVVFKND